MSAALTTHKRKGALSGMGVIAVSHGAGLRASTYARASCSVA